MGSMGEYMSMYLYICMDVRIYYCTVDYMYLVYLPR